MSPSELSWTAKNTPNKLYVCLYTRALKTKKSQRLDNLVPNLKTKASVISAKIGDFYHKTIEHSCFSLTKRNENIALYSMLMLQ